MIKIPEATAAAEFEKMPAGDYVCKIVKATNGVNHYDEPCLLLYLDVAQGKYKNYFGKIYQRRLDEDFDRYPCVFSQLVNKFAVRYFRKAIKAIEDSNMNYFFVCPAGSDWDETELEGLNVGVTFREKTFYSRRYDTQKTILVPAELKPVGEVKSED